MRTEKLPEREFNRPLTLHTANSDPGVLRKLFMDELYDICWAEKELTRLLSRLADNITSEELADALLDELSMSFTHLDRLEDAFLSMQEQLKYNRCDTLAQLIAEAERIVSVGKPGVIMDASLFSVVKRIRYYQIASYGIICSFLRTLGEIEVLTMMEASLEEEREAYRSLVHSSASLLHG